MFHGSIVALVTPLTADDHIDFDALTGLVDYHLDNKTDGIVAVGTTGESGTLTHSEHEKVIRHIVEQVDGRITVIAGTGAVSTQQTIELTEVAMGLGVDGCLIMTPAYIKPTQEGLYRHYKAVADAVHVPIILYNVPVRTAVDLLPETVIRLAECSNIVGIKEATGDIERVTTILNACGDKIDIFSGDDLTVKELIFAGGRGVISVTANVAPRLMHELCAACMAGDMDKARELDEKLAPLHNALFLESNPIPVKWAVAQMGLIGEHIRLPLTPLGGQYQQPLRQVLQEVEVLQ